MADERGFAPEALKVWTTGIAYIRMDGQAGLMTEAEWAARPIVPPTTYVNLGIWMKDGGPEDGRETGDAVEFYQPEFQLSGDVTRTVKIKAAEDNNAVTWLDTGKVVSASGAVIVDGVNDERFPLLIVQHRRDGALRYREGLARVHEFAPETSERGTVEPTSITFRWSRSEDLGGFYRQELILPAGAGTGGGGEESP